MPTKGKTAKAKKATVTEEPEEETYLNYIVNFNNCTIHKVYIKQTGKPKDPPPCPPGGC